MYPIKDHINNTRPKTTPPPPSGATSVSVSESSISTSCVTLIGPNSSCPVQEHDFKLSDQAQASESQATAAPQHICHQTRSNQPHHLSSSALICKRAGDGAYASKTKDQEAEELQAAKQTQCATLQVKLDAIVSKAKELFTPSTGTLTFEQITQKLIILKAEVSKQGLELGNDLAAEMWVANGDDYLSVKALAISVKAGSGKVLVLDTSKLFGSKGPQIDQLQFIPEKQWVEQYTAETDYVSFSAQSIDNIAQQPPEIQQEISLEKPIEPPSAKAMLKRRYTDHIQSADLVKARRMSLQQYFLDQTCESDMAWDSAVKTTTVLGRGAQGEVYKVETMSGNLYAAKRLFNPDDLQQEIDQFNIAGLSNQFPKCFGLKNLFGKAVIAMEFITGTDLNNFTQKLHSHVKATSQGSLMTGAALLITEDLFEGLSNLEGLKRAHRDIKPENIMVTSEGKIKIIDLGLVTSSLQSVSLSPVGTPTFIAPEVLLSSKDDTYAKADTYAGGNVALGLLTGHRISQDFQTLEDIQPGSPRKDAIQGIMEVVARRATPDTVLDGITREEKNLSPQGTFFSQDATFSEFLDLISDAIHSKVKSRPYPSQILEGIHEIKRKMPKNILERARELTAEIARKV